MKYDDRIQLSIKINQSIKFEKMEKLMSTLKEAGVSNQSFIYFEDECMEITFSVEGLESIVCGDCSPYEDKNDLLLLMHKKHWVKEEERKIDDAGFLHFSRTDLSDDGR